MDPLQLSVRGEFSSSIASRHSWRTRRKDYIGLKGFKHNSITCVSDHFLHVVLLTNFCAPSFKEIPSFFRVVTPSKTLAAPQPLTIVFSLGNGGVLRSQEGEGFRKEGGGGDGKKKKEKRTRKKC